MQKKFTCLIPFVTCARCNPSDCPEIGATIKEFTPDDTTSLLEKKKQKKLQNTNNNHESKRIPVDKQPIVVHTLAYFL